MSEHMKKPPIKAQANAGTLIVSYHRKTYAIPKEIANQYIVEREKKQTSSTIKKKKIKNLDSVFAKLESQYTKAGVLLKGLRLRENLSQVEFGKKIKVTQANLSNMENGKRPIGKIIAKRIGKIFNTNYRYFLE